MNRTRWHGVVLGLAFWPAAGRAAEPEPEPEPEAVVEPDPVEDPEPVPAPEPVVAPAPPAQSPRAAYKQARRQERKDERQAAWTGPLLPKEADFLQGDVEVRARLAFNGTEPGPFTLLTSLAGWNELGLVVDTGVASWRDWTIGVGGAAWYGQSLVLGLVAAPIANYDDFTFRWKEWEAGAVLRGSMHYTGLSGVDPYVVVGLGAGAFHLDATVNDWSPDVGRQGLTTAYLRGEVGGGLTWLFKGDWVVGVELRYLLSAQINPRDRFLFDDGTQTAVFVFANQHRPPKGFSWSVQAGYRF